MKLSVNCKLVFKVHKKARSSLKAIKPEYFGSQTKFDKLWKLTEKGKICEMEINSPIDIN